MFSDARVSPPRIEDADPSAFHGRQWRLRRKRGVHYYGKRLEVGTGMAQSMRGEVGHIYDRSFSEVLSTTSVGKPRNADEGSFALKMCAKSFVDPSACSIGANSR